MSHERGLLAYLRKGKTGLWFDMICFIEEKRKKERKVQRNFSSWLENLEAESQKQSSRNSEDI